MNGCWLQGGWVTVPEKEFPARKKAHEKLYRDLRKSAEGQHYRDKGVALKNMTPAQRQAYEHFSGTAVLDCRFPNGEIGKVSANLAGKKVAEVSLKWLREKGAKVIPKVLQPNKKVDNQARLVPADLLSDDTEPVDVWKLIVKRNKEHSRGFAKATAEMVAGKIPGPEGAPAGLSDFMAGVAVQNLLELEEQIIRHEIDKEPDVFETPAEVIAEYVEHRKEMKDSLGARFEEVYQAAKAEHNACERENLDNSEGELFCYVLPVFRDDGTHEPIGPRDFPWARKD